MAGRPAGKELVREESAAGIHIHIHIHIHTHTHKRIHIPIAGTPGRCGELPEFGARLSATARKLTLSPTEINFRSLPGPRYLHFGSLSL